MTPEPPTTEQDLQAENAELRARLRALEAEVTQLRTSTAATVAEAQESLYWFERWGVDFNSVFARREVEALRKVVRAVRSVYRSALKAKRSVRP